ncbi:MAG: TrkH family potassium uptake protein [Planctomycetes bacterium]|nr:TrkH family potassium uptake protein [Planctomycetota bacterium]
MQEISALELAARPKVILNLLGSLLGALSALCVVPAGVAFGCGDGEPALAFAAVALVTGAIGYGLRRLQPTRSIQRNEALVVTAAIFVLAAVVMTPPLLAYGLSARDAFFEAVSGVTTTGLTTLRRVQDMPDSFVFARAWMQWFGGLGIVALTIVFVLEPGIAVRQLGGEANDSPSESTRHRARRILVAYLALTSFGILVLWVLGLRPFDAVNIAMASVSTGGFAPHDDSIAAFQSPTVHMAVMGLSFLGALPLPLYLALHHRRIPWSRFWEVPALLVFGVVASLLIAMLQPAGNSFEQALFLGFSAQSTTGFSLGTTDIGAAASLVVVVSMLTGGCVASTAGGVKMLRTLILARVLRWQVQSTHLPPDAVAAPRLRGERLDAGEIQQALVIVLLFVGVVLASWWAFLLAGHDPVDALFEVASATGTVGLSSGITAPDLSLGLRSVLCADMLLGRLEVIAFLVLVAPSTWLGRKAT